jgi:hypothetical protein
MAPQRLDGTWGTKPALLVGWPTLRPLDGSNTNNESGSDSKFSQSPLPKVLG